MSLLPGYPATVSGPIGDQSDPSVSTSVLVVDKDRFSQLISRMLSTSFEVICVEEAPEAATVLLRRNPDIVVAELLDMNAVSHHPPFILTCIKPQADMMDKARKVGVDALLVKPFPPSSLVERIGAVIPGKPGRRPEQEASASTLDDLRETVRWIDGLPEIDLIHRDILQFGQTEGALNQDVSEQLKMDPFLVDATLNLANAFREVFPRKVATLRQATSLGGFSEVANLVLTIQVFETLGS